MGYVRICKAKFVDGRNWCVQLWLFRPHSLGVMLGTKEKGFTCKHISSVSWKLILMRRSSQSSWIIDRCSALNTNPASVAKREGKVSAVGLDQNSSYISTWWLWLNWWLQLCLHEYERGGSRGCFFFRHSSLFSWRVRLSFRLKTVVQRR